MKAIVIPDIHGRDLWRKIIKKEKDADKFIFLGDYWDSLDLPYIVQKENFNQILSFQAHNTEKTILLLGNHDFQYLRGQEGDCSGYQPRVRFEIEHLFQENIDKFQMAYLYENILFSHAGITQTWLNDKGIASNDQPIDVSINELWQFKPDHFQFFGLNSYGDDITQGPLWVRPKSLMRDRIKDYVQVVGHSSVKSIDLSTSNKVVFTDNFDTNTEYLIIEDGQFKVRGI